jgi:hypothetical protein
VISVILIILGGFLILEGAYRVCVMRANRKERHKDKAVYKAMSNYSVPRNDFVKIGSMPAPFSNVMHSCDVDKIDDSRFQIGDVVSCQNPDCGREYILGWALPSAPWNRDLLSGPGRDRKIWLTMEQYEADPGQHVYSK